MPGRPESANTLSKEWFSSIRTKTCWTGKNGRTSVCARTKVSWSPESVFVMTLGPLRYSSLGTSSLKTGPPPIHQLLVRR